MGSDLSTLNLPIEEIPQPYGSLIYKVETSLKYHGSVLL